MDCYAKFLIQFIYGMQQELKEVEVAVFSTHLTDITGLLRTEGISGRIERSGERCARLVGWDKDW